MIWGRTFPCSEGRKIVPDEASAEPLHSLIRKIRQPATLRELMAACLRSIYMGAPFMGEEGILPKLPEELLAEVSLTEYTMPGIRYAVYSPKKANQRLPLMLYMHGGGFVVGCSEDTDYITRMLCHSNQIVVVSVNYSLAPETVFPGALNDCERVLDLAISHSPQLNIDPTHLYFAGDSAGANLAMALCHRLLQHSSSIRGLVLFAPWLDMAVENYDSYNRLAPTGIVFDAAFLGYARAAYVGFEQWKNPLVSPLFSSLVNMPPTITVIGTEDPFIDQVLRLKETALDSGCRQIEFQIYPGMPHCFYLFPNLFSEEQHCYDRISDFIRKTSD
jgi:acetyl esterase